MKRTLGKNRHTSHESQGIHALWSRWERGEDDWIRLDWIALGLIGLEEVEEKTSIAQQHAKGGYGWPQTVKSLHPIQRIILTSPGKNDLRGWTTEGDEWLDGWMTGWKEWLEMMMIQATGWAPSQRGELRVISEIRYFSQQLPANFFQFLWVKDGMDMQSF